RGWLVPDILPVAGVVPNLEAVDPWEGWIERLERGAGVREHIGLRVGSGVVGHVVERRSTHLRGRDIPYHALAVFVGRYHQPKREGEDAGRWECPARGAEADHVHDAMIDYLDLWCRTDEIAQQPFAAAAGDDHGRPGTQLDDLAAPLQLHR